MSHVRKQLLSVYVSSTCNLNCQYCVLSVNNSEIKEEDTKINLKFAFKAIDDFFRDYPSRGIRFYGAGEPTIHLDLIRKIVTYVKNKSPQNHYFELQTNGFFSEKTADWLESEMDFIWVSFDGLPRFQDTNRPSKNGSATSNIVLRNINKFSKSDNVEVGCRITITADMLQEQLNIIDYLSEIGIKYISMERAFSSVNEQSYKVNEIDPIVFAKYFLEAYYYAEKKGIFYSHLNMVNFDEPTRFFCRACVPYPHLTTDGYVSCCDMAPFGKDEYKHLSQQDLIYGKYDAENNIITYDEGKIYNIRKRNSDNLSAGECKNCSIVYNCAGGCLGQSFNSESKIKGKTEWDCTVTKYLAKHMKLNEKLYPILHS